jgi:hypothetical protein
MLCRKQEFAAVIYASLTHSRTRKIRCDGAKPVCHNCGRRSTDNMECSYDAAPKRRGPDKTPGARQRMARDLRNEISNSAGPSRRRRKRPYDDTSNHGVSTSRLQIEELSDQATEELSPMWPISMPAVSPPSEIIHPLDNYPPVNYFSRDDAKLAPINDCGCPMPMVYGQDFLEGCEHDVRGSYLVFTCSNSQP